MKNLNYYLNHWKLVEDGLPIYTRTSCLQAVYFNGVPAMLKIAMVKEENRGAQLMAWWCGDGAALVLAQHEDATLLERASGSQSLVDMARRGQDEEASRIICHVAARLHAFRKQPLPDLVPLSLWFKSLIQHAPAHGGIFVDAATMASDLLATPQDSTVLHGDIHHANVMDFESRGWLAIDPKGLLGERAFDFANIFCNPDHAVATSPDRFLQRVELISEVAHLNRDRLLGWIASWAGLSATWHMEDGESPEAALTISSLAIEQLRGRCFH